MYTIIRTLTRFSREEDGVQVVEYALIVAVVSIALSLALANGGTGMIAVIADFVERVGKCLSGTGAC